MDKVGRIFSLMGKSSSGKDTVFKALIDDKELELQPIIPYTTRPIRHNEKNGSEYYFIDEHMLLSYRKAGKVIEQRDYQTVKGLWSYCTIDDGQFNLDEANYLIIATLESYKYLREYFGAEHVVPIYIYVEDGLRLQRALDRERTQESPNYYELCRRFLADSADFSNEKLLSLGISTAFSNNDLQNCIENIKKEVLGQLF